jgi:hypothetical protein
MMYPYHPYRLETSIATFSALLGLLLLVTACGNSRQSGGGANPVQAEAYKNQLELSHIGLVKGENYLGHQVFYVEGVVRNGGTRVVQRVELLFLFKDSLNQVVLKEARKAVDYRGSNGLEPQKSTNFQVAFERLPRDWNYVVPDVQINNINFK